eukprot:m.98758 g.98758  ORF g.98758 m.98758 type:complete len:429 (-) comp13646_c0_seq5:122-1408(-)
MTSLRDKLEPKFWCTDIHKASSHGLATSKHGACSLMHISTVPEQYYIARHWEEKLNMDRGGFGSTNYGTNYGFVFDGITAGGKINLYAAQAFANYAARWLGQYSEKFVQGSGELDSLAKQLFEGCVASENNPGHQDEKLDGSGGAATGLFATIEKSSKGSLVVHGASVGDSAAFQVFRSDENYGAARLLTAECIRNQQGASDNGGQLLLDIGIDGRIWTFSHPVNNEDLIILCSDGLTDNIFMPESRTIIPLILTLTAFDQPITTNCEQTLAGRLPTHAEISKLFARTQKDKLIDVSSKTAAVRLTHYVKWITLGRHKLEKEYFQLQTDLEMMSEQATISQSVPNNQELYMGSSSAVDKYLNQKRQTDLKTQNFIGGKTDDVIVVVFSPTEKGTRQKSEVKTDRPPSGIILPPRDYDNIHCDISYTIN